MSFALLFFEVEQAKKAGLLDQPKRAFSLSTFGNFAALRLRSRRALSSAHCAAKITRTRFCTQTNLEKTDVKT
jgi:hypothetical protein